MCFLVKFATFLKLPFLQKTSGLLLLIALKTRIMMHTVVRMIVQLISCKKRYFKVHFNSF